MESTLSKTLIKSNSIALTSHLHTHYSFTRPTQSIICTQLTNLRLRLTFSTQPTEPVQTLLRCFGRGGGNEGGVGGGSDGGGGGDGTADSRDIRANVVPIEVDDVSALSSDVIILDVGGMSCGGCVASVKRILESQPQVSSASVNLTTETAIVWPVSEAKVAPNWQKNFGDELAKHLTTCGFKSNPRGEATTEGEILS